MNLIYRPISLFYKEYFGEKIYKIPVVLSSRCPNQMNTVERPCLFCDQWGSLARTEVNEMNMKDQILYQISIIKKRYKATGFLIYYQAYTTTYLSLEKLKKSITESLKFDQIKGVIIGTRPDCLSPSFLDYLNNLNGFKAIELGIQSFFDHQLFFLRRGHNVQDNLKAIQLVSQYKNINLGVHLIFGLPEEIDSQIIETARTISDLPIHNVKLHHLHVLKNTPLEALYKQNQFTPISLDEYSHRVKIFLQYLSPKIFIHRLHAVSSRWDELIAPLWTQKKMYTTQHILNLMSFEKAYQGELFDEKKYHPNLQSPLRKRDDLRL